MLPECLFAARKPAPKFVTFDCEEPLYLDVYAGACLARVLPAVEAHHAPDAAFYAVGRDDHLREDFLSASLGDTAVSVALPEDDPDHACVAFDIAHELDACAGLYLGAVVGRKLCEPRVKDFAVEHDARVRFRDFDVHAVRAIDEKPVDDCFDTALVDGAECLEVGQRSARLPAAHREADAFALLEKQDLVPRPCEVPCDNGAAGPCANHHDIVTGIKHRSPP